MAALCEYYNTGDNSHSSAVQWLWRAQAFTPSVNHKITSVKLKLWRDADAKGTVTVSIRNTWAGGPYPDVEDDLCSGTIAVSSITTDHAGAWYEITLGAGYDLIADTKYAIVVRVPGSTAYYCVWWRYDSTGEYTGGEFWYSTDSGVNWDEEVGYDFMFEEWGELVVTAYNTMVGSPISWLWEQADYGGAEDCPVGSETSWVWKAPTSGGGEKTPQGAPTSFAWGSE